MKHIKIIFIILTICLFTNQTMAKDKNNEKTVTFMVNMDCNACVNKIQDNISFEKGVKDLKVSLDNKECQVTYRTNKTSIHELIKAFEKIGYTAELKKDKEDKKQNEQEM